MKKTELNRAEQNTLKAIAIDKFINEIESASLFFKDEDKDARAIKTHGAILKLIDVLEANDIITFEEWRTINEFTRF